MNEAQGASEYPLAGLFDLWQRFDCHYRRALEAGVTTGLDRARDAAIAALYAEQFEAVSAVLEQALAAEVCAETHPMADRRSAEAMVESKSSTGTPVDAERAMLALAADTDSETAALIYDRIASFVRFRHQVPTYGLDPAALRARRLVYERDGLRLRALVMEPSRAPPRGLAIYVHGGLFGLSPPSLVFGAALATRGFLVALPELRGQGGSQGLPEFLLGEIDDTLELTERVRARWPDLPPGEAYLGDSTGLPVALIAATRRPGALLVGGYAGPVDPVGLCERYPDAPATRALRVLVGRCDESSRAAYETRSAVRAVKNLGCRGVVFWGAQDDAVPLDQAVRLQEAARDARAPLAITIYGDQPHSLHQQLCGSQAAKDAWERLLCALDNAFTAKG
jgi:dienelactone hydrolase